MELVQKSVPLPWNVSEIYFDYIFGIFFLTLCYFSDFFDYLDAPVERITGADVPMPYSKGLETVAMVNSENIVNAVRRVCA